VAMTGVVRQKIKIMRQKREHLIIQGLVALFELIEFLENRDGNDDLVFLEIIDACQIMKNDIGIQDKGFGGGAAGHGRLVPRLKGVGRLEKTGGDSEEAGRAPARQRDRGHR